MRDFDPFRLWPCRFVIPSFPDDDSGARFAVRLAVFQISVGSCRQNDPCVVHFQQHGRVVRGYTATLAATIATAANVTAVAGPAVRQFLG